MEKPLINNENESNSNQFNIRSFNNLKPKSATLNLKTPIVHEERSRPKTTNTASSDFHREKTLTKITLSIDEQNKPDLLERYWKYNRIKRNDILKNRFADEAELNR
jgi:nucleoside-specific outer membrane channel protein Tsx